jgi:Putative peptidoglycan binding domain
MKKFITLLLSASLALVVAAQAKQADQKNKKSKPAPQQQVAPRQQKAPKTHVPKQQHQAPGPQMEKVKKAPKDPALHTDARIHNNKVKQPQLNSLPAVQSNKLKVNKTVKAFQPRHQDFHARVNSSIASARFDQNFRIRNAENWRGDHYNVFRTYRPQWHDRSWWSSNHSHILLIGGGWYYWNAGYWYPAWGYDNSAAYYPYDGPIYVGSSPRPFDQVVADVQSILQEQGLYRGEVDGLVGPLTQEALAAYQSAQGLEPTAAIDQPTLESLGIS